jgi:hypothetical protein
VFPGSSCQAIIRHRPRALGRWGVLILGIGHGKTGLSCHCYPLASQWRAAGLQQGCIFV